MLCASVISDDLTTPKVAGEVVDGHGSLEYEIAMYPYSWPIMILMS